VEEELQEEIEEEEVQLNKLFVMLMI
jgi:hypothetical protein